MIVAHATVAHRACEAPISPMPIPSTANEPDMTTLNLIVLRAQDPPALAEFYGLLGLRFEPEQHGNGPRHMACDTGAVVIEIYPSTEAQPSTRSVRLGFAVDDLDGRCNAVAASRGRLVRAPHVTAWGRRATIQDLEGHIVDLLEARIERSQRVYRHSDNSS